MPIEIRVIRRFAMGGIVRTARKSGEKVININNLGHGTPARSHVDHTRRTKIASPNETHAGRYGKQSTKGRARLWKTGANRGDVRARGRQRTGQDSPRR